MKKLIIISGLIIATSFILSGYVGNNQDLKEKAMNAAVSADQMNVFYAGIPNPVTAAAAGISPNDIIISITGAGASISGSDGKYNVNCTETGECLITVSAKTNKRVKAQGPPIKFRVKPLPKPEIKLLGKFAPAEMKKTDLLIVGAIGAGAPNFDFRADYIVQSWEVSSMINGALKTVSENGSALKKGDQIFTIEGINGKIVEVKDDATLIMEDEDGTKMKISKNAVNKHRNDLTDFFREAEVGNEIYIDAKVKSPDGKIHSIYSVIKVIR
jgi:preprotein translocase YajC subunit